MRHTNSGAGALPPASVTGQLRDPERRRALISACVANVIEWYDFAVFGALASVLAVVLLRPAAGDPRDGLGLIAVFGVFATSFLARPVGALVVGKRADQVGRRRMMAAMVLLMAVATAAIGVLPTWAVAGVVAPIGLLVLRLLQGFSSGGQITTSIAFLTECAPSARRGLYSGWHISTVALGFATGIATAGAVTRTLPEGELEAWGWRMPFLLALPLGLVGLFLRFRVVDSPAFAAAGPARAPVAVRGVLRRHRRAVVHGFLLVALFSGAFNLWFVYLPTHLATRDTVELSTALGAALAGLLALAVGAPMFGRLSDRVGRRPVLLGAIAALCILPVPAYLAATSGSVAALVVAEVAVATALSSLVLPAYLSERFPVGVRATGLALTFGLASALVGGTAPLVATAFARTGLTHVVPAYSIVLASLALSIMARAPETLPGFVDACTSRQRSPTSNDPLCRPSRDAAQREPTARAAPTTTSMAGDADRFD